jgi:hypothetical protein
VLFFRRFSMAWLAVIAGFHFMTLFAMTIFFWENLLLALALFGWGIWRPAPAELPA